MARVLVTGATGYLGRALVPRLADEHDVTTTSRGEPGALPTCDHLEIDLTDPRSTREALREFRWDAVVNLAGPVVRCALDWHGQREVLEAHVRIALSIREALPRGFEGRVVHTSSMMVYGHPATLPIAEDHPRRPINAYGVGKVLAEDVLLGAGLTDVWCLRLPGLFSPERREGALYHFVRAARAGEPIRVTASEPTPWDVLHVQDAAEAIARTLRAGAIGPGPINLGYGERIELVAIAERIARLGDKVVPAQNLTGIAHPPFEMAIDRARRFLGGWPPVSLQERLGELWGRAGPG